MVNPSTAQARVVVDELIRGGVRDIVLCPGSRNAPLAFADQYVGGLRRYRAISIDVGDQDGLRADAGKLHELLDTPDFDPPVGSFIV